MGGLVKGVLNAVGLVPDDPDMTSVANATKDSAALAKETADAQLKFAQQQYADQKPLIDQLGKQALANGELQQQSAKDQLARSAEQWSNYQQSTVPAIQQMGLNALGAQNLSAEQVARLQVLQQQAATGTPKQKAAAQAEITSLQKAATTNAIGLENAKADTIRATTGQQGQEVQAAYDKNAAATAQGGQAYADGLASIAAGAGQQTIGLGEENAQQITADGQVISGDLNALGDARRADQTGFYNTQAQTLRDTAKQRAADNELRANTKANADIAMAADEAQRNLLRLGGDPNRMAAMQAEIAGKQQLARIGSGNEVARTNIANLNAADDTARGLEQVGFKAGTDAQYAAQDSAVQVKSSALDAARASRATAKQTALGLTTDAAKTGLSAVTTANQSAADKSLAGTTAAQSLTFAGQNAADAIDNAAKDKVDANQNSLQQGAANYGAGFANTSGQAAQTSIAAGSSGTAGLATASNAGNGLTSTTLSGMNGGMTAAQIQNQGALGLASANTAQYNAESAAINAAIGSITGSGNGLKSLSDKNAKHGRKPVSDDAALAGLSNVAVDSWTYNKGRGDGGSHVGPMAQDMNKAFGDGVAPGGKQIDLVSQLGLQHAAIRALDKKVSQLERSNKGARK